MNEFEQACRPVIFESDQPEYRYWRKGSSFLIANSDNYYWVTATHVLNNMGACIESVRIFPSDNSQISLPFNEKYIINTDSTDDDDYKDIIMLRIDLHEFDGSGDAPLIAQDIEHGVLGAEQLKHSDELWVIGYPSESNIIDYDSRVIKTTRSVVRAVYDGRSIFNHCHQMKIESSIKLKDLDGLSGSPVFHIKHTNLNGQLVAFPMLVGMLLRGTASSGIAHFVSSNVIVRMVSLAENKA
ncbi:MAG: hypothetical protein Q7T29_08845 [Gallionella sp.]|nr:hypothetical protein [Gallionella sp.]